MVVIPGCSFGEDPKDHLPEIYTLALQSLMEEDEALNDDMEFIAIDMRNFKDLTDHDKGEILDYFSKEYRIEVMDADMEELKKRGLFNEEALALKGVLLRIENVDFSFLNNVTFTGSKYRSGLGAIGMEITIHFKANVWKVKKTKMTWISWSPEGSKTNVNKA